MSDGATQQKRTSGQARKKTRGPRSARHRANMAASAPVAPVASEAPAPVRDIVDTVVEVTPRRASRSRRPTVAPAFRPVELTRAEEAAYIQSDMRRLFVVSGILLALMVVILVVVG